MVALTAGIWQGVSAMTSAPATTPEQHEALSDAGKKLRHNPPMRWLSMVGLAIVACGCGGGGSAPRGGPVVPDRVVPPPADPPKAVPALLSSEVDPPSAWAAPPAQPPAQSVCLPARKLTAVVKRTKNYDFAEHPVLPLPYGPRIADLPRAGLPRSRRVVSEALRERSQVLKECYRWARFEREDLAGTLTVRFAIDEFGRTSNVQVTGDGEGQAELGACVTDVVTQLRLARAVPRVTDVTLPIRFRLSGQARPAKRPARPKGNPAMGSGPGHRCLLAPAEVPRDALVATAAVQVVDDFSQRQADDEEQERQLEECRKAGGPCRRAIHRIGVIGQAVRVSGLDKRTIRGVVRANQGAYRACYIDARARRPEVSGTVNLLLQIPSDGITTLAAVESSTSGDAKLDECLRVAFAELWFPASHEDLVVVRYPFVLAPAPALPPELPARATVAEIEAGARAALAAEDGARALRRWSALIAQAPDHENLCRWRLGALQALLLDAPWIDARVMAAATDLVAGLEARPDRACAEAAAITLETLAQEAENSGRVLLVEELLEVAVERYRLILRVPGLPNQAQLAERLDKLTGYLERREGYLSP
ncbi:MAG: AgmX/PglI C-terminal domain-containing protein [Deltaproteobacteria bacterium]|nr:AgmX/PglI C-terminal domain-containing protein [Deltaproteobacteria bacterium]